MNDLDHELDIDVEKDEDYNAEDGKFMNFSLFSGNLFSLPGMIVLPSL
jgi:hypothetical protein